MKLFAFLLCLLPAAVTAWPVLMIDEDSTVVDGGTYDRIEISAVQYVTVKNCSVINTTGDNYYAGILMSGTKRSTIENCYLDGGAGSSTGFGTCGGIKLNGAARVVIRNNIIHSMNDDGIRTESATLIDIIGNRIYNLISCGTGGVTFDCTCNNGHSDGIQPINAIRMNIIGNVFYNVPYSTSAIGPGGGTDVVIANNIVQWPGAYYPFYMYNFERLKVYNNVFWKGRSRGSVWYEFNLPGLEFRNNICLGVSLVHDAPYLPDQHTVENNLFLKDFNYESGNPHGLPVSNLQGVDPQFVGITENTTTWDMDVSDFELKSTSPAINAGYTGTDVPETDFYGFSRVGTPDIGPFEYGGVSGFEHYLANVPGKGLELDVAPNPVTDHIQFTCPDIMHGRMNLVVSDASGRPVHTFRGSGLGLTHIYTWDGADKLAPGRYYYSMTIDGMTKTGSLIKL